MSEILLDDLEKNYYLNIREFASGALEAVLKTVRPMKQEAMDASINGCLTSSRFLAPAVPKTEEQQEVSQADRAANLARAVRRAKQNIRWLCKVMEADRLFTCTYRENQEDREQVREDFARFLRLVRTGFKVKHADGSKTTYRAIPDWQYVAVLEKQGRGAFHIHCAVKGFQYIKTLRAAWYKACGGNGDEVGEKTPGSVNVTAPAKRWGSAGREWKTDKLVGYLVKYIHKTFDESATEKKRYWHAKDLKTPDVQRMWVGGTNIIDAIKSTVSTLELAHGLQAGFDMWLSTQNDCFWIAGRGDG